MPQNSNLKRDVENLVNQRLSWRVQERAMVALDQLEGGPGFDETPHGLRGAGQVVDGLEGASSTSSQGAGGGVHPQGVRPAVLSSSGSVGGPEPGGLGRPCIGRKR